jgi:hypothetical protein
MDLRRRHRRFLSPVLAVTLAVELSVVALAVGPSRPAVATPPPDAAVAIRSAVDAARHRGEQNVGEVPGVVVETEPLSRPEPALPSRPTPANAVPNVAVAAVVAKPAKAPKPAVAPKAVASSGSGAAPAASYRGKNRLWIPSLGINRSVSFYSCSRSTALANVVYRWGCGGTNNVYLMGHAHSVFRALHNAYYNGRLRKGMLVIYADASGRVTRYKVSFWKVVSPVGASWAYAAQSRPSMTLQTCVGANSKYRLVVRLVKSG